MLAIALASPLLLAAGPCPFSSCCRKSQIQTFLEQNEGPGLQHLALKTDDIFRAMREMRARWAAHAGQAGCARRWRCVLYGLDTTTASLT